ncbi:MAG: four helix bundle protein [Candidatus Binatia bacterium]
MDKGDLEGRTKDFALRVIRFVARLPNTKANNVLGYQLLRAGTSVAANYHEANRAESRADFIHKIAVLEKEISESRYWLELFEEDNPISEADQTYEIDEAERRALLKESVELLAIFTVIGKRTGSKIQNPKFAIRNSK